MGDNSKDSRFELVRQLRSQQVESWRSGHQQTVEELLETVETNLLSEDDLLELLYGEICLRTQHEDAPRVEEIVDRFPHLSERINRLFEMHEVFESEESQSLSTWDQSQIGTELFDGPSSAPTSWKSDDSNPLPTINGYEILEELGRGGMGRVFKARQEGTEQTVAVKMVRGDWLSQLDDDLRRHAINQFGMEVRATAQLKHPNIVNVLHMGEVDGQPFYAMEMVSGQSLFQLVANGPLGNREAARYVAQIAAAIHQTHQHGILHRDIKPQNVLVEHSTDTAKLADFGLAQLADADQEDNNSVAGTLAYMAPEQFRDAMPTTSSDIYSLGATLYHLLTGHAPFTADSLSDARRKIEHEEPRLPSGLNAKVAGDLQRICLKAMSKSPDDRHVTAGALADELNDYLERPQRAGDMANLSGQIFAAGLIILSLNAGVSWLLPSDSAASVGTLREIAIWILIALMYPAGFLVPSQLPGKSNRNQQETQAILWTLFAGKMFAVICICIMLRALLYPNVRSAIITSYPVFAALSGMVTFAMGPNFWSRFYITAFAFWALSLLMVSQIPSRWIPLEYGIALAIGVGAFAIYVRQLANEYR